MEMKETGEITFEDISKLTMDFFKDSPVGKNLEKAFVVYEKAQFVAAQMSKICSAEDLSLTKISTVLSLDIIKILLSGKRPEELKDEDWQKITNDVIDKAVVMDGRDYSTFIFDLYAYCIDSRAKVISVTKDSEKAQERSETIAALAEDLREAKQKLSDGEISEVDYTEECLWTSFDAMIKCLVAYINLHVTEEAGDLIQAASALAFEYGRYQLYKKEQALLDEYLENQCRLDEELQKRFDEFKAELYEDAEQFMSCINDAFEPGFREALIGSVDLARVAGVAEEEILHSTEEIDSFFLD